MHRYSKRHLNRDPKRDPRNESVRVFAPATVANLGPGFDVLGLAVQGIGDIVEARRTTGVGVQIAAIHGDEGRLPLDPLKNTAAIAATATLAAAGISAGIELTIQKGMPIGSGLGSSAASAAAAAFAVNLLVGSPLRKKQLIAPCIEAEAAVSGRHADNVAPSMLGGLVLIRSLDPLDILRLPVPQGLSVAVVTPAMELKTQAARAAIPPLLPLSHAIANMANLAAFVSACYSDNLALLGRCIEDAIATPARIEMIPGGAEAISAALDAGALGSSISGAGPSIFALCRSPRSAREVAIRMQAAFKQTAQLPSTFIISSADAPGARRL